MVEDSSVINFNWLLKFNLLPIGQNHANYIRDYRYKAYRFLQNKNIGGNQPSKRNLQLGYV